MKNILRAAATALCAFALGTSAQTFNPEVRISNNAAPSLMPVVAASGTNVYVAWVEMVATGSCTDFSASYCGDIWFSRSTDNGVTFSPAVNLTTGTTTRNDRLPVIAAGGTQVHVFWTDGLTNGVNGVSRVFTRRSTDSGVSFAAEVELTTGVDAFYSRPTSAVVDAAGNVHVVWYDTKTTGGAAGQIFYRCSSNLGVSYSAEINMSQFDGAADQEGPRLTQGTDGRLYMLVRSTRFGYPFGGFTPNEQVLYRSQTTAPGCPATWMHPSQKVSPGLPAEWANTFAGQVATGGANVLHAIYWSDKAGTNLYYRRGAVNGAGWGAPQDLSGFGQNHLQWDGNVAEMSGAGIGEDAAGKVHVVFGENNHIREGFQVGNLHYRCSNDGGLTFIPRTLATSTGETAQPRALYNNNRFHMVWMDWRDNNTGAEIYYRSVTTGTCVAAPNNIQVSTPTLAFGGQSMGTTSPAQTVTLTNTGGVAATINGIATSAQFGQTNNCGASLAPTAQCTVTVTFTPDPVGGAVNSTSNVVGSLNVSSTQGNPTVSLTGTGEKSLVTHFYRSILRRAPDGGGFNFWSAEGPRMQNLGANINEVWYAMAMFFYNGQEYANLARDNTGFVTDLYFTFFNRAPDSGGLNFWVNELNTGATREVVLASFMFSPEFANFTQGIFGNTAARAEVDMAGDFYRGLLARLPDDSGLNAWVTNFRHAQCQGAQAVYNMVEAISDGFVVSGEYTGRARTNSQYVGDLYNAFLRRGGDQAGVNFWINNLNTGATRSSVRQGFIQASEFQVRVNNVVNQGCLPGY